MKTAKRPSDQKGQRGQSLTEYILIITLIVIACIAVLRIYGEDIKNAFSNASQEVREATQDTGK